MRPNISRGKLHPAPRTMTEALARFKLVLHELDKIRHQLADPGRILWPQYKDTRAYDEWKVKATRAKGFFELEERHLIEWMERPPLFREAYVLLCTLEEETDFDGAESATMDKLREHFEDAKDERRTA